MSDHRERPASGTSRMPASIKLAAASAVLSLSGCVAMGGSDAGVRSDAPAETKAIANERADATPGERRSVIATAPAARDTAPRFDVDSEGTNAASFFRALSAYTPNNVVVHPGVRGSISLNLANVTVTEVLEIAGEVYGYGYRQGPSGIVIYPAAARTQIFEIDYLDLERTGSSRTRVSSGQVSEGAGMAGGLGGLNQMVGSFNQPPVGVGGAGRSGGVEISGSDINTTYEADFWSELKETLEQLVGTNPDNQVIVNSQTGVVMVRAMPAELRSVGQYLETIQRVAQRQVVLEAKIVEVTLTDSYSAGINWIAVAENSDGYGFTVGQTAPPPGFTGAIDTLGGDPVSLSPGNILESLPVTSSGGAFTMAFDIGDFNAFLELLELHGETRVLSSPRVSTLNNQKAVIKAGTDEFFVTNVASNTVTGASSTTSRDVQLTPFFSGIALDVTPQISGRGEVTLHIHPTVSEVTDQEKNLTVSGQTDVLPLAFSEVRESDSVVRAKSGQIIVIGGLMRNSESTQRFGIPGLSRVPGLGRLFSSTREINRKTELVILLKPVVVGDDHDWTGLMSGSIDADPLAGR